MKINYKFLLFSKILDNNKKCFSLKGFHIFFILFSISGFGQVTIFDQPGGGVAPAGWTFNNNVTTEVIDQSTYWLLEPAGTSDIITTNTINLTGYSAATLSFSFRRHNDGGTETRAKVEISYNGGTTYTQTVTSALTTNGYQAFTVNLSSITSQVRIRISNNSASTAFRGLRLRDLLLEATVAPPINDTCSGAISLSPSVNCVLTTGSTLGATDNNETGDCTTGNENSVWYKFIATATTHIVTVDGITGFDPVIKSLSTCGSLTSPTGGACVNATGDGGIETLNLTGLSIGVTYYVQIHDFDGDQTSNGFTICVTTPSAGPVNDICAGATPLTVNSGTACTVFTTGSTTGATDNNETGDCSVGSTQNAVWFSFTATQANHTVFVQGITGFNAVVKVLSVCGTTTSPIGGACVNLTGGAGSETLTLTGLVNGATYYVQVYDFDGDQTANGFTICVTTPALIYCTPTHSNETEAWISNVSFVGTQNDISNTSTYSSSPSGYQNFTGLASSASQIQGEAVNISVTLTEDMELMAWIDLNKDGDFVDANEVIYTSSGIELFSTTFGFTIPTTLTPGTYRIRIRARGNTPDTCSTYGNGTNNRGEAEDYLLTVIQRCDAEIISVSGNERCGAGTLSLSAVGSSNTTHFRWYSAATGGTLLHTSVASGAIGLYNPTITATTKYYVTAWNGSCETQIRKEVEARLKEVAAVNVTPAIPIACGDDTPIQLSASGNNETIYLLEENFDSGLGSFTSLVEGNSNAQTVWTGRTSPYVNASAGDTWKPAISSGFGTNKFAMSTADVNLPTNINNSIVSAAYNTTGFLNLTLTFKIYFSRYFANSVTPTLDFLAIEVSTDGGTSWNPTPVVKYITDQGLPAKFDVKTIDLSAYINQNNLKFRFRYYAEWCDGIALDEVKLYGQKPMATSFTWSGSDINVFTDAACVIPYIEGAVAASIYIKPSLALLELPTFDMTVSSVLTNACSSEQVISVTNYTKIWAGGASTDWNLASNWKPNGIPTSANCILVDEDVIISGVATDAFGKNIKVKSGGDLKVNSGNSISIKDGVTVQSGGSFILEDTASLVQEGNANLNSGSISVKRKAAPMKRYDFTYWSSPVESQTLYNLSPTTLSDKYYSWDAALQSWTIHYNGTDAMTNAKGYAVRAPQTFPIPSVNPIDFVGTFTGKPISGDVAINVYGSPSAVAANYKWNLIGNPYPSAISIDEFLADSFNNTKINGTIYIWTHNSPPSTAIPGSMTYNYTASDYAAYNGVGGTATSAATADPLHPVINPAPNISVPTGYLASGQSFFIRGKLSAVSSVRFTNDMREKFKNNQFFRSANTPHILDDSAKNRFWLNIRNDEGAFNQALIGYINGATNEIDDNFDGELFGGNYVTIYSLLSDKKFTIQGRALPFLNTDVIPIGIITTIAGNFTISLDMFDGLFTGQDIFLKDKDLNIIHDLKTGGYAFATPIGNFENRFEIVFQNISLGITHPEFNPNDIVIYKKDKTIIVTSASVAHDAVQVFDIQGRLLYEEKNINSLETVIKNLPDVDQILIVQVHTLNGEKVSKKIVF